MRTTLAGMKTTSMDDLLQEITDLRRLLDTTNEALNELDYGRGRTRNHQLDRVSSLTRIARDMAERLEDGLGNSTVVKGPGWTVLEDVPARTG